MKMTKISNGIIPGPECTPDETKVCKLLLYEELRELLFKNKNLKLFGSFFGILNFEISRDFKGFLEEFPAFPKLFPVFQGPAKI